MLPHRTLPCTTVVGASRPRHGYVRGVSFAPTLPGERLAHLDVLRGLALFGVLLENLQHFVVPSYAEIALAPEAGGLDRAAFALVRLLCDNKIYAIFSFLFGHGIALQMLRAEAAGVSFVGLHIWRMTLLFLIGVAHSLVWHGDILTTYAPLGVLLLPLRHRSDRSLIAVAALGFALPTLVGAGLTAWGAGLDATSLAQLQSDVTAEAYPARQSAFAFGAFALGLLAGRRGLLTSPATSMRPLRGAVGPALLLGLTCNLAALPLLNAPGQGHLSGTGVLLEALLALATPALAFTYAFAALALTRRIALPRIAAVGRSSLSNYLLQSCLGVGVLAHTGLGPLGPITPSAGIAVTFLIFAAQVVASAAWLSRWQFGPAEWVWRAATYGSPPVWRRQEPFSGP